MLFVAYLTIYLNQISFRHIFVNWTTQNILTCNKSNDIFTIYIYDLHILINYKIGSITVQYLASIILLSVR